MALRRVFADATALVTPRSDKATLPERLQRKYSDGSRQTTSWSATTRTTRLDWLPVLAGDALLHEPCTRVQTGADIPPARDARVVQGLAHLRGAAQAECRTVRRFLAVVVCYS